MRENVETTVRRAYEHAWNNGELESLLEMADPDIVFKTSGAFPDLEPEYVGHDGIRTYWSTIRGPGMDLTMEVVRVEEIGEEVLILFRFHATGRADLHVDARFAQVARMRDGLATEIVAYPGWESAARAVGLSAPG